MIFLSYNIIIDVLVSLSDCVNRCSCCGYYVNEDDESLTVCAEIIFINGTSSTTSNYTVNLSADRATYSAHSEFCLMYNKQCHYKIPDHWSYIDNNHCYSMYNLQTRHILGTT